MKMWRYFGPQQLHLEEGDAPHPGPGEVVVRIAACGICATDLKTYQRGHPLIPVGAVLGHEVVGIIAELGEGVIQWHVNDRVAVAPYLSCGACHFCERGQFTLCEHLFDASLDPGGFAEFARVPPRLVQRGMFNLGAGVDDTIGTLFEPLACCIHGLHALELGHGDSLLIIGDGPMGLLQAEAARAMGAQPIIVSGLMAHRLARAQRVADAALNPGEVDLVAEVKHLTNGYGADKVILSVPDSRLVEDALKAVARGGAINLFAGMPSQSQLALSAYRLHYDEVRVFGTFGFGPDDFRQAVGMVSQNAVRLDGIVTRIVRFDEVDTAFRTASPERDIKSVVVTG